MFPYPEEEVNRTLFVGNLEARVREEILYELFLQAGPLTKVTLCKSRKGKPKSFGFVCFKHRESVSYAIALLNGIRLYGKPISVQYRFGKYHTFEPTNLCFENGVKINSHSYRNGEAVGRSSVPMPFFPVSNVALPQEYFISPSMQWNNPVLQLHCYETTTIPLPNNTSMSSSGHGGPDPEAGPSLHGWTHPQSSDSDLYQRTKRKRQASESDGSTENKRGNENIQKFKKYQKNKRY
ncbi:splicing regulator RBM11 [Echinops telfairi]|uniref:Splicing regulator RBM11 n=1 Tax=Echinops telfairi TaxID=9371 RepID=A0ABM0IZB2_ECHTE|nr:splicing regulator RBM11 [Echinops telfairi]